MELNLQSLNKNEVEIDLTNESVIDIEDEEEKKQTMNTLEKQLKNWNSWKSCLPYIYDAFVHHSIQVSSLTCIQIGINQFSQNEVYMRNYKLYWGEHVKSDLSDSNYYFNIGFLEFPIEKQSFLDEINDFDRRSFSRNIQRVIKIEQSGPIIQIKQFPSAPQIVATLLKNKNLIYLLNTTNLEQYSFLSEIAASKYLAKFFLSFFLFFYFLLKNLTIFSRLIGAHKAIHCFAIANKDKYVIAGGEDKIVYLWELQASKKAYKPSFLGKSAHEYPISCLDFNTNNVNQFCSGDSKGTLFFWDKIKSSYENVYNSFFFLTCKILISFFCF